ncbi:DoxX family protein [Glycomyces sp. NPDC046736]|uniref:DoxX family protein n=1 Tax=Glycomyces sp. NPDC046736 TaxID=3155615 RepID=UPI0033F767D1
MEARGRLADAGVLLARLGTGVILLAYGWQKLAEWGLDATAQAMGGGGVPLPQVSAHVAAFGELAAGAALIAGVLVRAAAVGAALVMVGAIVFVNGASGIYADAGGYAFPLAVGVACLLLAVTGSGRYGLDPYVLPLVLRRRETHRAAA